MLLLYLGLGVSIGFLRPLRQNLQGELAHLRAHARFSLIGGAVVARRLIQRVSQLMQPCEHFGAVRQPRFQGAAGWESRRGLG